MRRRLSWRSCCSRGMVLRMEPSGGARHYSRKGSSKAARACIFRKSGPATAEGVSGPGYVIVQALGISGFPRPAASSLWFIPQAHMQAGRQAGRPCLQLIKYLHGHVPYLI